MTSADSRPGREEEERTVAQVLEVLPGLVRLLSGATAAPGSSGERLHLTQFRILRHLGEGRLLGSELAARLDLTAPAVSVAVEGLVRHGLVDRHRAEDGDRRAVPLTITEAGRQALAAARQRQQGALADLLHGLTPLERSHLAAGIEGLVRAQQQRRAR